jgi:hypothetical protein
VSSEGMPKNWQNLQVRPKGHFYNVDTSGPAEWTPWRHCRLGICQVDEHAGQLHACYRMDSHWRPSLGRHFFGLRKVSGARAFIRALMCERKPMPWQWAMAVVLWRARGAHGLGSSLIVGEIKWSTCLKEVTDEVPVSVLPGYWVRQEPSRDVFAPWRRSSLALTYV